MILDRYLKLPVSAGTQNFFVYNSGYAIGIFEALCGPCLIFSSTKKTAAWLLIVMHIFILFWLEPLGLHHNKVLWPWNLLLALEIYFIFVRKKGLPSLNIKMLFYDWNKLVLVVCGILPIFCFAGYWDNFLSAQLYTANFPFMAVCIKDTSNLNELKPYFTKKDKFNLCNGSVLLNIQTWSMNEMNVPVYPELRVYKKIKKER